ncbi:hypothetical protein HK103_007617 [Boothiomyces macroporosus]|uniref:AIG1-type G domain-containing protein n=1 Tax=Boothiomyces macroporosus TaxID=261099 RepID=A0AAD5UFQ1_9FUNG|nr:hypothetical protein HK103_007617 [Boothiomyces macroporosus]
MKTILLLGSAGSGKSTIGNLLISNSFPVNNSTLPCTQSVSIKSLGSLTVIDTPPDFKSKLGQQIDCLLFVINVRHILSSDLQYYTRIAEHIPSGIIFTHCCHFGATKFSNETLGGSVKKSDLLEQRQKEWLEVQCENREFMNLIDKCKTETGYRIAYVENGIEKRYLEKSLGARIAVQNLVDQLPSSPTNYDRLIDIQHELFNPADKLAYRIISIPQIEESAINTLLTLSGSQETLNEFNTKIKIENIKKRRLATPPVKQVKSLPKTNYHESDQEDDSEEVEKKKKRPEKDDGNRKRRRNYSSDIHDILKQWFFSNSKAWLT